MAAAVTGDERREGAWRCVEKEGLARGTLRADAALRGCRVAAAARVISVTHPNKTTAPIKARFPYHTYRMLQLSPGRLGYNRHPICPNPVAPALSAQHPTSIAPAVPPIANQVPCLMPHATRTDLPTDQPPPPTPVVRSMLSLSVPPLTPGVGHPLPEPAAASVGDAGLPAPILDELGLRRRERCRGRVGAEREHQQDEGGDPGPEVCCRVLKVFFCLYVAGCAWVSFSCIYGAQQERGWRVCSFWRAQNGVCLASTTARYLRGPRPFAVVLLALAAALI